MTFQKGNKIGHRFQKGHKTNIGRKHSEETKNIMSLSKIGNKGCLGYKRTEEENLKNRLAHLGENNGMWVGDKVGYSALHDWIRRNLSVPDLCQQCNKNPPYDLANITGEYNREFTNWLYLCRSCHAKLDGLVNNLGRRNPEGKNQYSKCEPKITPPPE